MRMILLLACSFLATQTMGQNDPLFTRGELSKTANHTGNIWLSELSKPDSIFNLSLAQAIFDAGAKLDWHVHPAGQFLLITAGEGYYQERGKAKQTVKKGDVIKCLPGVEHWHGALPNSNFSYVGVTPSSKGKTVWLEKVTDADYTKSNMTTTNSPTKADQDIISLSKTKWQWMADKNTDSLSRLFDDQSVFVHMGGSWGKEQEINIIKSGGIHYKKADIHEVSVKIIGKTAILLNRITLLAVVGGNEVTNPFMVTEVYTEEAGQWKLGSLSFTKLMTPQ